MEGVSFCNTCEDIAKQLTLNFDYELEEKQKILTKEQEKNQTLSNKQKELDIQLEDFKKDLQEKEHLNKSLTRENGALKKKIEDCDREKTNFEDEVLSLKSQIKNKEQTNQNLLNKIRRIEQVLKEKEENCQCEELQNEKENLEQVLLQINAKYEQEKRDFLEMKELLQSRENNLFHHPSEAFSSLQEEFSAIGDIPSTLQEKDKEIEELKRKFIELETKCQLLENSRDLYQQKYEQNLEEKRQLNKELEALSQKCSQLENELKTQSNSKNVNPIFEELQKLKEDYEVIHAKLMNATKSPIPTDDSDELLITNDLQDEENNSESITSEIQTELDQTPLQLSCEETKLCSHNFEENEKLNLKLQLHEKLLKESQKRLSFWKSLGYLALTESSAFFLFSLMYVFVQGAEYEFTPPT